MALQLDFGLGFEDLYHRDGLVRLDAAFVDHLKGGDVALHNRLMAGRTDPDAVADKDESQLIIDLAPHLEDFVAKLFGIGPAVAALRARHDRLAPLYTVKRLFVQRRAAKAHKADEAAGFDRPALTEALEAP